MITQHHVCGHDLGQARDGHRLAAAVRAEQAGTGQANRCLRPAGPVRARRGPRHDPGRRDRRRQGHRRDRAQQLHRTQATAATTMTAPAISARDRSRRLPAAARRGRAWRPARRGARSAACGPRPGTPCGARHITRTTLSHPVPHGPSRLTGMGRLAFSGQLYLRYFMLRAAGSGTRRGLLAESCNRVPSGDACNYSGSRCTGQCPPVLSFASGTRSGAPARP